MRKTSIQLYLFILIASFSTSVYGQDMFEDKGFQPFDLPGMAAVEGTSLAVKGGGTDITVLSSESVRLTAQSVGETIVIGVEPIGGASTARIMVAGLVPNATYYMYIDNLSASEVIAADASGSYTFDQDISSAHSIHIFTKHSTFFLNDDTAGGDCASLGAWDNATKTCTLTQDMTDTIQINSSGITLDGNGHTITGKGTGYGIYATNVSNIAVKNLSITGFSKGIMFDSNVQNSSIVSNRLYGNNYAIEFWRFSGQNKIMNNEITGNSGWSVHLNLGCNSNIFENNIFTNNRSAVFFINAHYNTIKNNMIDNTIDITTRSGVSMFWSCVNTFEKNTVSHTSTAFYYYGRNWCGNSVFKGNTISDNGTGMYLMAPTNTIYRNNFINNGVQIWNDPNYASNNFYSQANKFNLELPFGGNYFSSFDTDEDGCTDANTDGICDAPFAFSTGQDDFPFNHFVSLNSPPAAKAGSDLTVLYSAAAGGTNVTLDGGASSDPDSDALTYTWTWAGGTATGVSPAIVLPAGKTVVTLTVNDGNGESASDTVIINVVYGFGGFLQPVSPGRAFRLGSTVPVKFQLFDASGASVATAAARISLVPLSNSAPVGEAIDGTSNVPDAGNIFRHDVLDSQYIYNLSTAPLGVGAWRIMVTLDDGMIYMAEIGIK